MAVKVVCAILVLLPTIAICACRGSNCTTPNGEAAKCTPISACNLIRNAVGTRNKAAIEFAKGSHCGYDSEPLVCCGTSSIKTARGSSCTTPNGERATCKALIGCKVIVDAVSTRNKKAIEFYKNSQCGYDSEPLVCCGSMGYPSTQPPVTSLSPFLPDRSSCGLINSFRIVGGEPTQIWEHPWVALLRYKNFDGSDAGFKCGGSIINNRYVLTAAHCVDISSNKGFELDSVRLGEWKMSTEYDCEEDECADPVVDLKIDERIINRQYDRRSGKNDIALLRLERNVSFSDYIQPICLPTRSAPTPAEGTKLVVVGWGATENSSISDDKLKVEVPIVSLSYCSSKLSNRGRQITDDQLCAGVAGKDSCRGDSGGALMGVFDKQVNGKDQWYQEGVVSWGVGCGVPEYPGVYTRVARYMTWLVDNLKEF